MATNTPNTAEFFLPDGRLIDMKALQSLAGNDEQFIGQLLHLFQHKAPKTMGSVDESLNAHDYEALRYHVHSYKSTVSIFGNTSLSNLVSTIERMAIDKAQWALLEEKVSTLRAVSQMLMKEVVRDLRIVEAA